MKDDTSFLKTLETMAASLCTSTALLPMERAQIAHLAAAEAYATIARVVMTEERNIRRERPIREAKAS